MEKGESITLDKYIRKMEKDKEKKTKKKAKEKKKKEIKKIKKNTKDKKKKEIKINEIKEKYSDMSPKEFLYDIARKAKPPGKRTSKSGRKYYEYRRNRTDKEDGI